MKNNSALPSQKNKKQKPFTVSVFVCVREKCSNSCIAMCVSKGDSTSLIFTFHLSIYSTIKRKGTFCGLFLATFHCKYRATKMRNTD